MLFFSGCHRQAILEILHFFFQAILILYFLTGKYGKNRTLRKKMWKELLLSDLENSFGETPRFDFTIS